MSYLTAWHTFYAFTGAAAASLIGLMFVAMTLGAGQRVRRSPDGIAAFLAPTVVHYTVALAVAGILSAPWPMLWPAGLLLGLTGLAGLAYSAVVLRRLRRHVVVYRPVLEDWAWHVAFPLAAYAALVIAAAALPGNPAPALFASGAASVLLLLIGIHNAWDSATFIALRLSGPGAGPAAAEGAAPGHEPAPGRTTPR